MENITWLAYKLEGTNMETVNLEFIYQLGARIHVLTTIEYTTKNRGDICDLINGFGDGLQILFKEYPDLTVCKTDGLVFLDSVKHVSKWEKKYLNQKGARIDKSDVETDQIFEGLLDRARKFEIVLRADLRNLNIYHPLDKGGYNTQTLLSEAEQILGKDIVLKLGKDVIRELRVFQRFFMPRWPQAFYRRHRPFQGSPTCRRPSCRSQPGLTKCSP